MIRAERIKDLLAEHLSGFRPNNKTLEALDGIGYLKEIEDGEPGAVEAAAEAVREMHERIGVPMLRPEPPAMLRERSGNVPLRVTAVSILLASEAAREEDVIAFRKDELRGKLLTEERVESWLKDRRGRDGPPWNILGYGVPGSDWPHFIKISATGKLENLRVLSEALAKRFAWQPAQATMFVLTGVPPLVSALSVEYRLRQPPAASRLVLTIDPMLPPAEVARRYEKARRAMLNSRSRALSDKHMQLAIFVAGRPEGEIWKRSMAAWNKQFPKWKYKHETNFARDASQARERLLNPPFSPYPRA